MGKEDATDGGGGTAKAGGATDPRSWPPEGGRRRARAATLGESPGRDGSNCACTWSRVGAGAKAKEAPEEAAAAPAAAAPGPGPAP